MMKSRSKEVQFFSFDENFAKGTSWYHAHFPFPHSIRNGAITYEASPGYIYFPNSAERIFAYDSNLKLIALLRNPVDRAFSAWNMYHKIASHPQRRARISPVYYTMGDFDSVVHDEIEMIGKGKADYVTSLLLRGIYCDQLQRYLSYFKRDQILIIESGEARNHTQAMLVRITKFLGLPEYDWKRETARSKADAARKAGHYVATMSAETRALLSDFYRPHNRRLFELLGEDFAWH